MPVRASVGDWSLCREQHAHCAHGRAAGVVIESSAARYFNKFFSLQSFIPSWLHLFYLMFKILQFSLYLQELEWLPASPSLTLFSDALQLPLHLCVCVSLVLSLFLTTLFSLASRTESDLCPDVGHWQVLAYAIRLCLWSHPSNSWAQG